MIQNENEPSTEDDNVDHHGRDRCSFHRFSIRKLSFTDATTIFILVSTTDEVYFPCSLLVHIDREPRTVIHVKRAKMFDPMG